MTDSLPPSVTFHGEAQEFPLLTFGNVLLRWRRAIVATAFGGAFLGISAGLLVTRNYESTATFIPQGSEGGGAASGLELAASEFGIRVPTGGAFGPPVYVELLRSRALLDPVALDTVEVLEEGGRRVAIRELLGVDTRSSDAVLNALRRVISASEVKALFAVRITVATRWPSVSLALADRLVHLINEFNLRTRRTQAAAERQFVENQAVDAERTLREAEDRLQAFLQQNRSAANSPELSFQRDRLQRDVNLSQSTYTSLVLRKVEARIKEVRDTPLITVLEAPRLPLVGKSRRLLFRGVLGALAGAMLAVLIAMMAREIEGARHESSPVAREFFILLEEASPRWMKSLLPRLLARFRRGAR